MAQNINAITKYITAFVFAILLAACGNDSNSSSGLDNDCYDCGSVEEYDLTDFGSCTGDREGDTVRLDEVFAVYLCKNGTWVDLGEIPFTDSPALSSCSEYQSSSDAIVVPEKKDAFDPCGSKNNGVIIEYKKNFYICRDSVWEHATTLELDTYGFLGSDGDVKTGVMNKDKYYVYENGTWRVTTNELEIIFGACMASREGEKKSLNAEHYICRSNTWEIVAALEYDTYGWDSGTEGEVRVGNENKDKYYVYENGVWRASANGIEDNLGACVASREGEFARYPWGGYYICKSNTWETMSALEYDTYGEECTSVNIGGLIRGNVLKDNIYYCTANGWAMLMAGWSWDVPKEAYLNPDITYGTMIDSRDGNVYKTVEIGTQTWMAENLNYSDSVTTPSLLNRNWCYNDESKNCDLAGRLYTWSAAIDSVKLYTDKSVDCGEGKTCVLPDTVYGICPPGWHLPDTTEWRNLFNAVRGESGAGTVLASQRGWWSEYNRGKNTYGFSALPAGRRYYGLFYDDGYDAFFWSATEYSNGFAYNMYLLYGLGNAFLNDNGKGNGFSVRCVKDTN